MEASVYFVLFLCGIFSQGICNLSEDINATEKSSDILIRRSRMTGGTRLSARHAPYLVAILLNRYYHCPATLLTANVAITSAQCVINQNQGMMSIHSTTSVGDTRHEIARVILLDPNFNSSRPTVNNLALLKFAPAINFSFSYHRPALIFSGNLAVLDLTFEVVNWQKSRDRGIPSVFTQSLFMRLISIQYCQSILPGIIGAGNLCAHAEKPGARCYDDDNGSPLLMEGHLLGIMVFHGFSHRINTEVYMNLLDPAIRDWIHQHVPSLRLM